MPGVAQGPKATAALRKWVLDRLSRAFDGIEPGDTVDAAGLLLDKASNDDEEENENKGLK